MIKYNDKDISSSFYDVLDDIAELKDRFKENELCRNMSILVLREFLYRDHYPDITYYRDMLVDVYNLYDYMPVNYEEWVRYTNEISGLAQKYNENRLIIGLIDSTLHNTEKDTIKKS